MQRIDDAPSLLRMRDLLSPCFGLLGVNTRFEAQLACVPSIALEVPPKADVLGGDGVLPHIWQAEKGNCRRQYTQAPRNEKGILIPLHRIITTSILNIRKDISTYEGSYLSEGCSDTVISSSNTCGARFGCKKADVVARTELTEGEEDAVHNGEGGDVFGNLRVDACHNETDDRLDKNTEDEGILWAQPVADKGAEDGTRDVEEVDDGVPAEDRCQGDAIAAAVNTFEDRGGVDAESIGRKLILLSVIGGMSHDHGSTYIVEKPDYADTEEAPPVILEYQGIWRLALHRVTSKTLGLFESEAEDE